MNENSLPYVVILTVLIGSITGVALVIGFSNESKKCIKSGCELHRAYASEYCYLHKPSGKKTTSSETSADSKKPSDSSSGGSPKTSSTSSSDSGSKPSSGDSHSSKSTTAASSYSSGTKKSSTKRTAKKRSSHNAYDEGYDDIYMDDDYDEKRYRTDKDYADGVDDAMDEFDEDW